MFSTTSAQPLSTGAAKLLATAKAAFGSFRLAASRTAALLMSNPANRKGRPCRSSSAQMAPS